MAGVILLCLLIRFGNSKFPLKPISFCGLCYTRKSRLLMCCQKKKRKPWKMLSYQWCCLCEASDESQDHLFTCSFANALWRKLWGTFGLRHPIPSAFLECIACDPQVVDSGRLSKKRKKLWLLASISLLWAIWLERKE